MHLISHNRAGRRRNRAWLMNLSSKDGKLYSKHYVMELWGEDGKMGHAFCKPI